MFICLFFRCLALHSHPRPCSRGRSGSGVGAGEGSAGRRPGRASPAGCDSWKPLRDAGFEKKELLAVQKLGGSQTRSGKHVKIGVCIVVVVMEFIRGEPRNPRMGQAGREHGGSPGPSSLLQPAQSTGTGLYLDGSGISSVRDTPYPPCCEKRQSIVFKILKV